MVRRATFADNNKRTTVHATISRGKIVLEAPQPSMSASDDTSESASATDVGEDKYILTGYGDISLSNMDYVPGLPEAISPKRDSSFRMRVRSRRDGRPPAPNGRKVKARVPGGQFELIPGTVKTKPPVPKNDREEFEALVESLKTKLVQGGTERRNTRITLWLDQCKGFKHAVGEAVDPDFQAPENRQQRMSSVATPGASARDEETSRLRSDESKSILEEAEQIYEQGNATSKAAGMHIKRSMTPSDYAVVKGAPKPLRGCARLPRRPPIPTWD